MNRRRFIGPNGARFSRPDPLPRWLAQGVERGEYTEVTDGAAVVAPSASDSIDKKPRPSRPKGAAKPPTAKKPAAKKTSS